jgi:glucose-1-phosphate thymidylyltransferase
MSTFKGIILAGGTGKRLYPITLGVSKQMLPIYDKPMIYYPLSILMLSGIKEILIISSSEDMPLYKRLLGNGSTFGISLEYCVQPSPDGLAQAFILGKKFIGNSNVSLALGDNIFYGENLTTKLNSAVSNLSGATLFGYRVKKPDEFGVIEFDKNGNVISIEEKPKNPKSNYAITGLYFYDNDVVSIAETIKPSKRNELEITDINNVYLKNNNVKIELLSRGFAWLDTGTHESLIEASQFVQTVEKRQGLKIACIEEIAYKNGWISYEEIIKKGESMKNNGYGQYLLNITKKTY